MKIAFRSTALALGLAASVVLSGCAATRQAAVIDHRTAATTYRHQDALANPVQPSKSFAVNNGFYAARSPLAVVPVNKRQALPAAFARDAAMNDQSPILLTDLVARITQRLGYPVSIDQDVLQQKSSTAGSPMAAPALNPGAAVGQPASAPSSLPPLPGSSDSAATALVLPPEVLPNTPLTLPNFIYKGNLEGLLDTVTGKLNLSWRWTGDRVEIFRFETKMFRLDALAETTTGSANLTTSSTTGGGAGGGSSGGSGVQGASSTGTSGQTTTLSFKSAVWDDVEKAIKGVISKDGTLSMVPSAGLITVRDTPAVLRQVEAQVAEFNRLYGREVTLNVEIYAIERTSADQAGLDWNALYNKAGEFGLTLSSSGSLGGAGGAQGGQALTFTQQNGRFAGSTAMFQALSSLGRTSLVTSNTVVATNGQSVPVNVSREQTYVQSYATTLNSGTGGGQTTTITPGLVSDGISMNFTPRILDNNEVIVRYALDLSTTEAITTFTAPDNSAAIQLPRRAVRTFLNSARIHSGDTLVLTGFQQIQSSLDGQGPGSSKLWFLGGSKSSSALARSIVVVITPYVTER